MASNFLLRDQWQFSPLVNLANRIYRLANIGRKKSQKECISFAHQASYNSSSGAERMPCFNKARLKTDADDQVESFFQHNNTKHI